MYVKNEVIKEEKWKEQSWTSDVPSNSVTFPNLYDTGSDKNAAYHIKSNNNHIFLCISICIFVSAYWAINGVATSCKIIYVDCKCLNQRNA